MVDVTGYRALRDFYVQVGDSLVYVQAGSILDDPAMLGRIDLSRCPVAPLGGPPRAQCPSCHRVFAYEAEPGDVYRAYRAFSVQVGMSLLSFRLGECVHDPRLLARLDLARLPLGIDETVVRVRCPHCLGFFAWET